VHKVSSEWNQELLAKAFEGRHNIVLPTLGREKYLEKTITKSKNLGYRASVIHSNVSLDNSMKRSVIRFEKGENLNGKFVHRLVDPKLIKDDMGFVDSLPDTLKKWVKEGFIDNLKIFDNNGKKPPKLIEELFRR